MLSTWKRLIALKDLLFEQNLQLLLKIMLYVLVLGISSDQYSLLDYQRDHLLKRLNKFFLESQIVRDNNNVPSS